MISRAKTVLVGEIKREHIALKIYLIPPKITLHVKLLIKGELCVTSVFQCVATQDCFHFYISWPGLLSTDCFHQD